MGKKRVIKKTQEEALEDVGAVKTAKKEVISARPAKRILKGLAYIQASYNNTAITMTDTHGNVIAWSSAGSVGFKGAKKATPFAASRVAEVLVEKIRRIGIKDIDVRVRGIGSGRDSAIRSLASHGLNIISIEDITPLPHNGCRPRKTRRV